MTAKLLRILSNIISAVLLLAAAALLLPRLFGFTPYTVLSGSMEPAYPVGSVVFVQKAQPQSIRPGDVIMYRLSGGMPVTHRVVALDGDANAFITKGDANGSEDPSPIPFDALTGKARLCLPLLGYAAVFVQTLPGMLCVALCAAAALLLPHLARLAEETRRSPKAG